jgi:hypothetical protein
MAGTTPTLGFPYPDGGDLVRDGDDVIKALALAVEAAMTAAPPAWTTITLNANYTPRAGYHVPAYRVLSDGTVQLRGGITKSSAIITADSPFTLPVAARPVAAVSMAVGTTRASGVVNITVGRLDIATTGVATLAVIDAQSSVNMTLDGVQYSKG